MAEGAVGLRQARPQHAGVGQRVPPCARIPQQVPQDAGERDSLRARLRQWTRDAGLVPPLDVEHLRACTARAVLDCGVRPQHRDFAAVLVGNACWETALAAVPFGRRLLLLPRCLRAERCRASADALGLCCERCGACAIDALTADAEALGYHVLVAEGATSVGGLVQAGAVEGVVAVACLHSLERSYAAAAAGAVPALAVPLLDAGCRGTSVDVDWVRSTLRLRSDEAQSPRLDLDRLRERVQRWFAEPALRALVGAEGTPTEALALAATARAGKRWRPTLAAAVRQALAGGETDDEQNLQRVAVAVECFHKASLVHDDIEDDDPERDGTPTLHAAHGVACALNAGDLLIGEGYRLLAEAGAAAHTTVLLVQAAARAHRELCLGQGAELAWRRRPRRLARAEALDMLRRKTAPAFELPLVLGATLAGADRSTCRALRAFSAALGLAYQVRDDAEDAGGTREGEPPSPLLAALAFEAGNDERALRFVEGRTSAAERRELLDLVLPVAREVFESYRAESLRALRPLLCQPLKAVLFRLVHLFLGVARDARPPGGTHDRQRRDDAA